MPRYVILSMYPLVFVALVYAAWQSRKLSRDYPSTAWTFKRRLMIVFMVFQVYGTIRTWTVVRVFTWYDPIYISGVMGFFVGLNWFEYLLRRDARGLRGKASKLALDSPPQSGELPPDFWSKEFRRAVRDCIKEEFLKPERS